MQFTHILISFTALLASLLDVGESKKAGKPKRVIGSYKNRRKCSHFQQSGCLLTIIEHICDHHQNPNEFNHEVRRHLLHQAERCCCSQPFQDCQEDSKNLQCRDIFSKHIDGITTNGVASENINDNVISFKTTLNAFNSIRQDLLSIDLERSSKYLSSAIQSPVKCHHENIPPFLRQDHRCEQLYWSFEELGIDVEGEMLDAGCPFKESYRGAVATDRHLPSFEKNDDKVSISDPLHQDQHYHQNSYQIRSYQDRRRCRYWQQSGCLLDTMEKLCEGETEPTDLVTSTGQENIHLCCCPQPYKACRRSEADQFCLQLIGKYFLSSGANKMDASKHGPESKDTDNSNSREVFLQNVQTIRNELLASESNCMSLLASPEPWVQCSMVPSSKPFTRHDLICEMLTWQWEELGDGNNEEFRKINCPFIEKDKAVAEDGAQRKGAIGFIEDDNDNGVENQQKFEL